MTLSLAVLQHEAATTLGAFAPLLDGVDFDVVATTEAGLPDVRSFDGAVVLGGSLGAYAPRLVETRRWLRDAVLLGRPVFGVCLGGQLLATALGATVRASPKPEVGVHDVLLTDAGVRDVLFAGLPRRLRVLGWHEDAFTLPPRAVPLGGSIGCTYQAFRYDAMHYGLQFHPEVRVDDLARWRSVPHYDALLGRVGGDWDTVAAALAESTAELDLLASQLLERWLYLVDGMRTLREHEVDARLVRAR